jgi:GNAT superfamily N-acetyltransferase
MIIRRGTDADFTETMRLMDEAIAWLAGQGRTGQWGSDPWSTNERIAGRLREEWDGNDPWVAEIDGRVVGAMLLGSGPLPYIDPIEEPEVYLHLLVTDRSRKGSGIGAALVAKAKEEAAARGVDLIRVDCYGGDDRKLVSAYERMGFTPIRDFKVGEWPGQLLGLRLSGEPVRDEA